MGIIIEVFGDALGWIGAIGLALAGILIILIWTRNKTKRVSYLRLFIGFVSLAAIYFSFMFPIWLLLLLIIIFVATLFFGRAFCGWVCPFGLYMDLITKFRKSLKVDYWNLPEKANRVLNALRYPIMLTFLILPFIIGPTYLFLLPLALYFRGPFTALTVLLGPLEPLIVPWAGGPWGFTEFEPTSWIFRELGLTQFSVSYPYVRPIIYYATETPFLIPAVLIFVSITLLTSFKVRRFWCRFCPTGISLAIVNRFRGFKWVPILHLDKEEEKCTKCGICKRVCPVQVTEVYEQKGGKIRTSMCVLCLRCVEMCPYEGCLKVKVGKKTIFKSRNWLEPATTE
jgi:ferredoxin-type protein NapH